MAHSERFEELAAARALDLPLGDEAAEFARHLDEGCPTCEELLLDFRAASTALAFAVPARAPGREVKERIFASLGQARRRPPVAPWLAAAAAALLFVLVAFDDARLRREREELHQRTADLAARLSGAQQDLARQALRARVLESEDVRILFLGGKDPQPEARGRVFWSERAKRGILVAANLAPLPPGKQYELWVFEKGKPVAAGVFDVDASGRVLFESPDLARIATAENFAVTVEPSGGVAQPTGPIVLLGNPSA